MLVLWPSAGHGQARLRVLLLGTDQAGFTERVRGQTGDLAIELVVLPHESSLDATASVLHHAADAALWLESAPGRPPCVHLFDAQGAVTQVRDAEAASGGHTGDSARQEIAAMLARGELIELIASRQSRIETSSTQDRSEQPAAAEATSTDATKTSPGDRGKVTEERSDSDPRVGTAERSSYFSMTLGLRATQVSAARALLGPEVGLWLRLAAWHFGLTYAGTFEDERTLQGVRVGLREDRLAAHLGGTLLYGPWQFVAGIDLGCAMFARETLSVSPELTAAAAARQAGFVGGPRVGIRWIPRWFFQLGFDLGVDFLATKPVYQLASQSGREELEALRRVQPAATLWLAGFTR